MKWWENTSCKWNSVEVKEALELLEAYKGWRRKRVKPEFITVGGENYRVVFESENKSSFWRSRGFSFYFEKVSTGEIIRISDHWSESKYKRSNKFNAGSIGSCYWRNLEADSLTWCVPGEQWPSQFLAGKAKMEDFKTLI